VFRLHPIFDVSTDSPKSVAFAEASSSAESALEVRDHTITIRPDADLGNFFRDVPRDSGENRVDK
jgi:hypothetical protein